VINVSGVRKSAVASQLCPSGHITADKKEIKDFPKSRQVGTSFIRETRNRCLLRNAGCGMRSEKSGYGFGK
jgi:hypothetical protein